MDNGGGVKPDEVKDASNVISMEEEVVHKNGIDSSQKVDDCNETSEKQCVRNIKIKFKGDVLPDEVVIVSDDESTDDDENEHVGRDSKDEKSIGGNGNDEMNNEGDNAKKNGNACDDAFVSVDDVEEEEQEEEENDTNDALCSICDDGGTLICCEGSCMRSFHPNKESISSTHCSSLNINPKDFESIPFYCKNCEQNIHQCFICKKLGSSVSSDGKEPQVFICCIPLCGKYYHPRCINLFKRQNSMEKNNIVSAGMKPGEPLICPNHLCLKCKRNEIEENKSSLVSCRRCPTSYHLGCIPNDLLHANPTRVWGVIPDPNDPFPKILYCYKHPIDLNILTPVQDHILFPSKDKKSAKSKHFSSSTIHGSNTFENAYEDVDITVDDDDEDFVDEDEKNGGDKLHDHQRRKESRIHSQAQSFPSHSKEGKPEDGYRHSDFMLKEKKSIAKLKLKKQVRIEEDQEMAFNLNDDNENNMGDTRQHHHGHDDFQSHMNHKTIPEPRELNSKTEKFHRLEESFMNNLMVSIFGKDSDNDEGGDDVNNTIDAHVNKNASYIESDNNIHESVILDSVKGKTADELKIFEPLKPQASKGIKCLTPSGMKKKFNSESCLGKRSGIDMKIYNKGNIEKNSDKLKNFEKKLHPIVKKRKTILIEPRINKSFAEFYNTEVSLKTHSSPTMNIDGNKVNVEADAHKWKEGMEVDKMKKTNKVEEMRDEMLTTRVDTESVLKHPSPTLNIDGNKVNVEADTHRWKEGMVINRLKKTKKVAIKKNEMLTTGVDAGSVLTSDVLKTSQYSTTPNRKLKPQKLDEIDKKFYFLEVHKMSQMRKNIRELCRGVEKQVTMETIEKRLVIPLNYSLLGKKKAFIYTESQVASLSTAIQLANEEKKKGNFEKANIIFSKESANALLKYHESLRVYFAPFLHGNMYTSFGRHFTKVEKLKHIVSMLQWHVFDGNMIVDFSCGSNDFSLILHSELPKYNKPNCLFKNFDILHPKNKFCFEQRDWFTVKKGDLPLNDNPPLIIGLNPPFGVAGALAYKFMRHSIKEFSPHLLIMIVPPETKRLEDLGYELIWVFDDILCGESFYLPETTDKHFQPLSHFNKVAPPLYLWSRSDVAHIHRGIARARGFTLYDGLIQTQYHHGLDGSGEVLAYQDLDAADNFHDQQCLPSQGSPSHLLLREPNATLMDNEAVQHQFNSFDHPQTGFPKLEPTLDSSEAPPLSSSCSPQEKEIELENPADHPAQN